MQTPRDLDDAISAYKKAEASVDPALPPVQLHQARRTDRSPNAP
jgi:hypothetical protein